MDNQERHFRGSMVLGPDLLWSQALLASFSAARSGQQASASSMRIDRAGRSLACGGPGGLAGHAVPDNEGPSRWPTYHGLRNSG